MKVDIRKLLTLKAYSDMKGFSDTKTRYLIKQGKLKSLTIGGKGKNRGVQFIILENE
jgi:hypothetical protein